MSKQTIFYCLMISALLSYSCKKKSDDPQASPAPITQDPLPPPPLTKNIAIDSVGSNYDYMNTWNQQGNAITLDLNNDGINDIKFGYSSSGGLGGSGNTTTVQSLHNQCYIASFQKIDTLCSYDTQINGYDLNMTQNYPPSYPNPTNIQLNINTYTYPKVLRNGDSLNASINWNNQSPAFTLQRHSQINMAPNLLYENFGPWRGAQNAFVGIKLIDTAQRVYLGWIKISSPADDKAYVYKYALKQVLEQ